MGFYSRNYHNSFTTKKNEQYCLVRELNFIVFLRSISEDWGILEHLNL